MIQFPFAAIVGMEDAKSSLIYHAIDPRIGGTLFLGHRGCAKSTLVRAYAEVLRLACDRDVPFVEVPLGVTEDRLLGSVDAHSLVENRLWTDRIGLIEEANGGVLYIDEVNLLPDHLADFILDSASSDQYRMERDGIRRVVESRYILVGTMNPEEGDLRPQLSDRFAHGVPIRDEFSPKERMEIVRRRIEFDDGPGAFVEAYRESTTALAADISAARRILASVNVSDERRLAVAAKASEFKLEGLRAELAVIRTARCAAAWAKRSAVDECDLEVAWRLCLGHRHIATTLNSRSAPSPLVTGRSAPLDGRSGPTSRAPLEARADGKELFELVPSPRYDLLQWFERKSELRDRFLPLRGGATSEQKATNPIAWIETLVASVRNGWLDDTSRIAFRGRTLRRNRHVWCFLDASRSTGMNQFLGRARDLLAGTASFVRSGRFHLLLLARGEVRWRCRNATSRTFINELRLLREAGGKSFIVEALTSLHRRSLAQRTDNRVLILSDGLASPHCGERFSSTVLRLRRIVRRLASNGSDVAWVSPDPKRGLKRWIPQLLHGSSVARFEI
jgi:Mg-chelatase subunit ChlI